MPRAQYQKVVCCLSKGGGGGGEVGGRNCYPGGMCNPGGLPIKSEGDQNVKGTKCFQILCPRVR